MVVRRIKDKWHNSTPDNPDRHVLSEKSADDHASALGFIIWRQSLNTAINLHAEDFRYDNDQQRIAVISELVAFQVQLVDRRCHQLFDQNERTLLVTSLCQRLADQMQDNLEDIAGPGGYRQPFIALLNNRFTEYADFEFSDAQPGYDVLRFLARQILDIMGEDQTNRWVMDQIIDLDAPALVEQLSKSVNRLFGVKGA